MAQLLTVLQCSQRLGLAPSTIRKMLMRGELTRIYPTERRGAVRVLEEEIDELIVKASARPHNAKSLNDPDLSGGKEQSFR